MSSTYSPNQFHSSTDQK
jgi:hypothetical protein